MQSQIVAWAKRLLEVLVGLLALSISGLTLWMCWKALTSPDPDAVRDPDAVTGLGLWSILAFVAGVAIALVLFGLRLIFPQLRVDGQHVIGLRGLIGFAYLYGMVILAGLLSGRAAGGRLITGILMLVGVGGLIYDRLRAAATR